MDEFSHCTILSHQIENLPEQELAEKLKLLTEEVNRHGIEQNRVLNELGVGNIEDCVVGTHSAAFLLKDGRVVRLGFESKTQAPIAVPVAAPPENNSQVSQSASPSTAARNATAKFRRVMLSTSSFRRERGGVIMDRGRPLPSAASVPEDLIAQAQVVLQGKSREVIVRELQRTNLNVNEAVNNLLSRDDDEDDDDSAGEVVLPEELLSLLDPSQHPLLDADSYGEGFESVFGRDAARRKAEKDKDKKSREGASGKESAVPRSRLELVDTLEYWVDGENGLPEGVERFVKLAATSSEVLAVSSSGVVYAWNWEKPSGDLEPHPIAKNLLTDSEHVAEIAACGLRVAVLTKSGKVGSWMNHCVLGKRVCEATEIKPVPITLHGDESIVQLVVSNHLTLVVTSNNVFHWCGLYPFSERPKLWEKERAKTRKHVTFDINNTDIKEGSEVRTKASPIYSAGSVAVNISTHLPMVGVLMESVWTISEVCRFRVMDPKRYDADFPKEESGGQDGSATVPANGESRKRRASQEVFDAPVAPREEAWGVGDIIWIHEQQTQDTAVVKIVDGLYVGVEYMPAPANGEFASSMSGSLGTKDTNSSKTQGRMRILRKDDLCLMTPKLKNSRSPRVIQHEPLRFVLSGGGGRKVISAVVDSNGIRALVEKRGRIFVTRASVTGKVLSEHLLHVHPAALMGSSGQTPKLLNYGEDSILLLKDGNGSLLPLIRDALMGFREPLTLHLPPLHHVALSVATVPSPSCAKVVPRKATLLAIAGPSTAAMYAQLPSLMQNVLYADSEGVKKLLDRLHEIEDPDLIKAELVDARSDGGSNILHVAVRLAIAKKNKDDADPGTTHGIRLTVEETKNAREQDRDLEQKWQRLLRSNRAELAAREGEAAVIQAAPMQDNAVQSPGEEGVDVEKTQSSSSTVQSMPVLSEETVSSVPTYGVAVDGDKDRQKGAIATVKVILEHPAAAAYLSLLLTHRDSGGLTPFQTAVNIRAYGAASHIWTTIKKACETASDSSALMQKMIHPTGCRPDDSPLFVLCYNDICSFTWTGEEHINQDIFECRTCGLVGSLCCCTECAFTCHRNHDCKLKRTSPTAYCDCWEKCPCKALVAGNQEKREYLLREMIKLTRLHEHVNNRGDHILLFLARTVGRQQIEQGNYSRRRGHGAATAGEPANTPEHDLDPPKFSKFALEACLGEWNVVKSAINCGIRNLDPTQPVFEDVICLTSQHGATHLEKMVFTLFSKCGDQAVQQLIDSLIVAANGKDSSRDSSVDNTVSRLVRSVLRLYLLCVSLSPTAAAAAIRGTSVQTTTSTTSRSERRAGYHALTLGGFLSLVRNETTPKEPKINAVTNLIVRFRTALMRLAPFAVKQVAYTADAVLAPVRVGILRPISTLTLAHNQDCLDVIEKFLNGENDLTSQLAKAEEARERPQRKRKNSRRDTDRGDDDMDGSRRDDSDDSDSDADGQSSRRHNSQSGLDDTATTSMSDTRTPARTSDVTAGSTATSATRYNELSDESSTDSDSEDDDDDDEEGHVLVDDEDDDDLDNIDEEETEDDERANGNEDGDESFYRDEQDNDEDAPNAASNANQQVATEQPEQNSTNNDVMDTSAHEENDDSTRDAVHSEASSVDVDPAESAEERLARRMNESDPVGSDLSAVMRRMPPPSTSESETVYTTSTTVSDASPARGRGSRRGRGGVPHPPHPHSIAWAMRPTRGQNETNQAARDRIRPDDREDSPIYNPGMPATARNSIFATTGANGRAAASRKTNKTDSSTPSTQQTSIQLSTAFAFAVRLLCDLLCKLHSRPAANETAGVVLDWNMSTLQNAVGIVISRMALSWNWMEVVLDRMEAQLLFGNAVMASAIGDMRAKPLKKKEKEGSAGKKEKEDSSSSHSRRETMEYLVATMRAQSGEAGDDYPIVDVETIRMLVFIFDANLCYHESIENCKEMLLANQREAGNEENDSDQLTGDKVRSFFQRSNSICFPGSVGSASNAWDTLGRHSSHIPLAEKSYLLDPNAEQETMFAPHHVAVSKNDYIKSSHDMGAPHLMNMSFTHPCDEEDESDNQGEEEVEEVMEEDVQMEMEPPQGMDKLTVESIRAHIRETIRNPVNVSLARWKNVLQYIAKECHQTLLDSYGGEPGSSHLLSTIARFPVRQTMFRKVMDKFRTTQSKDVSLEVHRDSVQLIRDTVFQLNQTYVRRMNAPKSRNDPSTSLLTPMGSARMKVKFHDEPGEGSGVARSFYTALAEALQSQKKLPFEELGWDGNDDYLFGGRAGTPLCTQNSQYASRERPSMGRIALIRDRGTTSAILSRKKSTKRSPLSVHAQHFSVNDVTEAEQRLETGVYRTERPSEEAAREHITVAEAVYCRVRKLRPAAASRISGMLVDLSVNNCIQILGNQDLLAQYVDDAVNLMLQTGLPTDLAMLTEHEEKTVTAVSSEPHPSTDDAPLFSRTSRRGFFSPVPGKLSPIRLSAFRNVGRVVGLCLSQGDLFPLKLARHVLKYVLGRPVNWMDLQFYDAQLFDSLRQMMSDEHDDEFFSALHLRFVIDVPSEDPTQHPTEIELKPGGKDIAVTKDTLIEYVYRFVEMKMLGPDNTKCLSAIRQGVFDVIPSDSLDSLTAEDLRLILCGTEHVCMTTLQSLTTFSDESHASADVLNKFKEWFWAVVDGLSTQDKQDLIFFWTGAPSLPTSAEFIPPQPTVMIRPPDDVYLPTANTCISRLYVPLYSSKKVLRSKLQLAIKTKNFGFV